MRSSFLSTLAVGLGAMAAMAQAQIADESVLFRWNFDEKRFERVTPGDIEPKNFYLRWDNRQQTHVWVTGDNRHMILNTSKVQGGRLGFTGKEARNWYVYSDTREPRWKKNTERVRPEVWRWDPARVVGGSWSTGSYRSERAGDEWETWGAELDPILPPVKPPPVDPPPVKPPPNPNDLTCEVSASPSTAKVGETVLLTMKTTGPVTAATLDGAAVDFPSVMRAKTVEAPANARLPAKVKIVGEVKAPNQGRAECSVDILVVTN